MPPKVKITKEELLETGFSIARESGIEGVTARSIGSKLGLSSRATYSYFTSVELLKKEIVGKIYSHLFNLLVKLDPKLDPFISISVNYIKFAKRDKNLYRIINFSGLEYTKEHRVLYTDMMMDIVSKTTKYSTYDLSEIRSLFFKMGIFIHGFADIIYQSAQGEYEDDFIGEVVISTAVALVENIKPKTT